MVWNYILRKHLDVTERVSTHSIPYYFCFYVNCCVLWSRPLLCTLLFFKAGDCFNSQNFREMIPLLGVFRILAIVIFGMFPCVFSTYSIICLTAVIILFNVSFKHMFFLQLAQILDSPSIDDSSTTRLVCRYDFPPPRVAENFGKIKNKNKGSRWTFPDKERA